MPLRRMTGRERSERANWQLAALLAFTAGVVDVTGFLGLRQFTSHMSGVTATLAAELGTQGVRVLTRPAIVLGCFLAGAAFCAVVVNWERRRNRESLFAVPVAIEAMLLAAVALFGGSGHLLASLAVMGFSMGLQNAVITKISDAEIRTTHVTGTITDIGIELGRLLYWNRTPRGTEVRADGRKLVLLTMLVVLFFGGGTLSAVMFQRLGFSLMLPLAVLLAVPTILPIAADFNGRQKVRI
jgi:uncharacterized membrane protein YoaK (UPF0700 family)